MMDMAEKVRNGLPLTGILVVDCHCHIGSWFNFNIPDGAAEKMMASMDVLGIDLAFITALSAIGPDYRYGNDQVMEVVRKYPERFLGYATVNPNYSHEMEAELSRCFENAGIRGIKLHPAMHGRPIDDPDYQAAFSFAEERRCPLLIHVWGTADVAAVDRLAARYSKAQFIMGHAGGEPGAMAEAVKTAKKFDNVYVDLAVSRTYEGNVEWFVKELGSRKILYGSDMPFLDPKPAFGRVALSNISTEEKMDLYGLNMKRLLQL